MVRGLARPLREQPVERIRLPTADADKRAVELDQFPSTVIRTIEVNKTFTPDQQGDASGGGEHGAEGHPRCHLFLLQSLHLGGIPKRVVAATSCRTTAGGVGDFGFESDSRTIGRVGPYFEGLGGGDPDFNFVVDRPGH